MATQRTTTKLNWIISRTVEPLTSDYSNKFEFQAAHWLTMATLLFLLEPRGNTRETSNVNWVVATVLMFSNLLIVNGALLVLLIRYSSIDFSVNHLLTDKADRRCCGLELIFINQDKLKGEKLCGFYYRMIPICNMKSINAKPLKRIIEEWIWVLLFMVLRK